jgi:serine phosphatase RsbU (regulator of sigma subunit)
MKNTFLVFFFTFCLISGVYPQEVIFPITNYSTKDYGREFHPQNWAVAQDQRGIIYFANGFKLLEFDSHSWNSYPINKGTMILSLGVDSSGIIYAGSQNEFGFFAPDHEAGFKYFSLSDSLNVEDMMFSNIRNINVIQGGVAFQAEEKLFVLRNGKIYVINPATSFHTSFAVNNVLYIRQRETGLMELKGDILKEIEGGARFASTGIFMMIPFGNNGKEILIGTREIGFWLFSPLKVTDKFRPFIIKEQKFIDDAILTGGTVLPDGLTALSTLNSGIIIIDSEGNIVSVINKESGLGDNDVKQVITDKYHNLWLTLENGISTIEVSSPISFYTGKSGIEGSVQAIIRYKGLLYAGTTTGLYIQQNKSRSGIQFVPAFNLSNPVRSFIEINDRLLAGTDAGIFEIKSTGIERISNERSSTLYYSPDFNLLISGGNGISVFQVGNTWKKIKLPDDILSDIVAVTGKESKNADSCEIWIGTRYDGTLRLVFNRNLQCRIDHYSVSDGLAAGPVIPFNLEKEVVFGTIEGLSKFIPEDIVKETLPDSLKNDPDFSRGYFSSFYFSKDSMGKSFSSLVDSPEKIWICADNHLGYLNKSNYDLFIRAPFMGVDAGKINCIYPEKDGICWFGTTDGLIRYNVNSGKNYSAEFQSLIRKVLVIRADSILFSGVFFTMDTTGTKITNLQTDLLKPELPFRNNSIRVDFAATFFENPDKIMFSCRLGGYDTTWTNWEHKYYQEYTNLHEGDYTFRVRAKNIYGQISDEAHYNFSILPPWYRTLTAYFLYVLASCAFIWLIIRLYTIRLKRENIRLEGIVRERTAEVVSQRDVLEHQKKEIEDSIRYASRIQTAVLPADQEFTNLVPESFVFFRPRDIVSGDFYWVSRIDNKLIISAADCTGHGVPGAFMSMLGVAFLNEIVNKDHVTKPEIILNMLREKVIGALQQQGISGEAKDGMDIVVISIDEKEGKLCFAGAYNSLLMIRKGQLSEYRGDRMPIAIFDYMKEFSAHEILTEKGDLFYFSSDGYEDQFGGSEGKKFKSKQFKELLLKTWDKPMRDQKDIIIRTFDEWKGEMNQIDDIVVIGVRI